MAGGSCDGFAKKKSAGCYEVASVVGLYRSGIGIVYKIIKFIVFNFIKGV
jgi:hypothetical protein